MASVVRRTAAEPAGSIEGELSPRAQRRRRLQEISRGQLLDAAESVFAEKGFAATGVKEVADRAELSVGTVYQLFESKRAIFQAVFQRRNQDGLAVLRSAIDAQDTPRRQLHRLVDATLDYYTAHRSFFLLFQRAIGGAWLNMKAGFDSRNFDEYLEFVEIPADIFRRGTAAGVFVPLAPDGMAVMYTGLMQAYLLHEVIGLEPSHPDGSNRMTRTDLHSVIDRAFGSGTTTAQDTDGTGPPVTARRTRSGTIGGPSIVTPRL